MVSANPVVSDTMSPVVVRPLRWRDIEAILELERNLFAPDAWSAETFRSELAQADTRYYIVVSDSAPILGYAGLRVVGTEGDIQTIAVDRSHWGQGLGSVLLSALLAEAAHRGCRKVFLEVRADNPRARRLYERFGFTPLGIRRSYYQRAGVDAVTMKLTDVGKWATTAGAGNG